MEWIEWLESGLEEIVIIVEFALEAISVFCVIVGLIKTGQLSLTLGRRHRSTPYPFNKVRLCFGSWLAIALEFQLGADILATTVAPTLADLGKLALIAIIRTFLNYFLGKELETELELEEKAASAAESRAIEKR